MLIQATTPRPAIDVQRQPSYILVHTLRKPGVSTGSVLFGGAVDPTGTGLRENQLLEAFNEYPIGGDLDFTASEYILPFWGLFRPEDKRHNLGLVPFCSGGFSVVARSAYRVDTRTYAERVLTFVVQFPVTGGGIVRMGDMLLDIANPTFDPWAPNPKGIVFRNLETSAIYNRMHTGGRRADIDARRDARIAEAESNMQANQGLPGPKLLPRG